MTKHSLEVAEQANEEAENLTSKCEDILKDSNKKLSAVFRELEKLTLSQERRVTHDELNERLELKIDRAACIQMLNQRPTKNDLEPLMQSKVDLHELDRMLHAVEQKFETEFANLHEGLSLKASTDDVAYYRKELQFKLDRSEIEAFKHDFVEKLTKFDYKMNDCAGNMAKLRETVEHVDQALQTIKTTLPPKIDQKANLTDLHALKNDLRA